MQPETGTELQPDLEQHQLKTKDGLVSISGWYWKTDRIYLNDICMAVVLEPIGERISTGEGAREELYEMLRWIAAQTSYHNLSRPLAAFVRTGDDSKTVAAWAADQDWHRGHFTLYVQDPAEPGKLAPTCEELLDPRISLLPSTLYHQSLDSEVLNKACRFDNPSPELAKLCEVITGIVGAMEKDPDIETRKKRVESCLDEWLRDILREAGAEGVG